MNYYFAPSEAYENGQLNPAVYPEMAAIFGFLMFVIIIASGLGTHNRIPHLAEQVRLAPVDCETQITSPRLRRS